VHIDEEMGLCIDVRRLGGTCCLHSVASENQNEDREESTSHGIKPPVLDSDGVRACEHQDCTASINAESDVHDAEQLLDDDARAVDAEHAEHDGDLVRLLGA
jgi:hypothetical protein